MSLYGFNRTALNSGVSGIIAGAALVAVTSSFASEGVREVRPTATVAAISTSASTGNVIALGAVTFAPVIEFTATPALLQFQFSNIYVSSTLKATATNAWSNFVSNATATGTKIHGGASTLAGVATVSATGLFTIGYSSNINVTGTLVVDPRIKLNGQSTWQTDGYSTSFAASDATANSLRTALGYASGETASDVISEGTQVHGGSALIHSAWETSAIAATDLCSSKATSNAIATGVRTAYSGAAFDVSIGFAANGLVTAFGIAETATSIASVSANGRLALLTAANVLADSTASATGRLAILSRATIIADSTATAEATQIKPGNAEIVGISIATAAERLGLLGSAAAVASSEGSAHWIILVSGAASIPVDFAITALPYTNAEAPDPEERTMYRAASDRTMYRSFIDRTMRRQP